jgi:hypothetical protein
MDEASLHLLKVAELQAYLKAMGLPKKGKKDDLVARLVKAQKNSPGPLSLQLFGKKDEGGEKRERDEGKELAEGQATTVTIVESDDSAKKHKGPVIEEVVAKVAENKVADSVGVLSSPPAAVAGPSSGKRNKKKLSKTAKAALLKEKLSAELEKATAAYIDAKARDELEEAIKIKAQIAEIETKLANVPVIKAPASPKASKLPLTLFADLAKAKADYADAKDKDELEVALKFKEQIVALEAKVLSGDVEKKKTPPAKAAGPKTTPTKGNGPKATPPKPRNKL